MKKSSENIAGFFHWATQPNLLSINYIYSFGLCISVKLKNLKANHNSEDDPFSRLSGCVYP